MLVKKAKQQNCKPQYLITILLFYLQPRIFICRGENGKIKQVSGRITIKEDCALQYNDKRLKKCNLSYHNMILVKGKQHNPTVAIHCS